LRLGTGGRAGGGPAGVAPACGAARTIAVVSTQDKVAVAKSAGANDVVLADGFKDSVKALTDGRGVDIVVDPVGGDRFTDSLRSLAVGGRLLVIGFTGGEIPTVKVNRLLLNNVDTVGVGWGAWTFSHPGFLAEQWAELEPLVRSLVDALLAPTGVGYVLEHQRGVPPVVNEAVSTGLLREGVAAALGVDALTVTEQSAGGEDFGWYLEHVPGSMCRLGVWPGEGPQHDLHQPTFDLDERALPLGVRVMVHTALAALAGPR